MDATGNTTRMSMSTMLTMAALVLFFGLGGGMVGNGYFSAIERRDNPAPAISTLSQGELAALVLSGRYDIESTEAVGEGIGMVVRFFDGRERGTNTHHRVFCTVDMDGGTACRALVAAGAE
jgi:hypothetical protein